MSTDTYSATYRTVIPAGGGARVLDTAPGDGNWVIQSLHYALPSSPDAVAQFVNINYPPDGDLFLLIRPMAVATTGQLPNNYLQEDAFWPILRDEVVVAQQVGGTSPVVITIGLRAYRAGTVGAGRAVTRDTVVDIAGPVPDGQSWLIRDLVVSQRDVTDPGPCPWSAGSAALGSQGQVAGTLIASTELPETPNYEHLRPRILLRPGETFQGFKQFGGDQELCWRASYFVLTPPFTADPVP